MGKVNLTQQSLAEVGVELVSADPLVLQCRTCLGQWTPGQTAGGELPPDWWRCPFDHSPGRLPTLLPPSGLTQAEADALPVPDETPPALADALIAIVQRVAGPDPGETAAEDHE